MIRADRFTALVAIKVEIAVTTLYIAITHGILLPSLQYSFRAIALARFPFQPIQCVEKGTILQAALILWIMDRPIDQQFI